uniref:Uncharacterized protein n=1 Tax=Romanomermis culicivorax TaxID=13658 RepID=A0A915J542_ROMCU
MQTKPPSRKLATFGTDVYVFSQFVALEERNNIESAIYILLNNKRRSCTIESYNVEGCQPLKPTHLVVLCQKELK